MTATVQLRWEEGTFPHFGAKSELLHVTVGDKEKLTSVLWLRKRSTAL